MATILLHRISARWLYVNRTNHRNRRIINTIVTSSSSITAVSLCVIEVVSCTAL
uniref:Uncharacterized protein n=1 Tax=Anopheles maculatus TaxID=74869 RepID=A0A182T401_9DIPT